MLVLGQTDASFTMVLITVKIKNNKWERNGIEGLWEEWRRVQERKM